MKKRVEWGTSVETTQLAITKNIFPTHRKGIYLGRVKFSFSIYVICEGQVTPQKYHPSFWREEK